MLIKSRSTLFTLYKEEDLQPWELQAIVDYCAVPELVHFAKYLLNRKR